VRSGSQEERPATVVGRLPKQAGDIRARWAWVEPVVWTDRMLAALEQGVRGGVWFSLVDKVYSQKTLRASWERVRANRGSGGVDGMTVERFGMDVEERIGKLSASLREGKYQPLSVRRVWIPKSDGRRRPLGIPAVRDRIVQGALRSVLEPIFEKEFSEHSYGFRPGRGPKDALRRVDRLLKAGYTHVVDADLKSYFDTIPHEKLMELVSERVADGRVLKLVGMYLKQGVLEGMRGWTPLQGTPQGAVISPLLSNVYLDPLDHLMKGSGFEMTRYGDDFVIQCGSESEAEKALELLRQWVEGSGLKLHPDKTRVVDMSKPGGFDFLGYHFERDRHWPSDKSLRKFKDKIRGKTKRTNGHSMKEIITEVNKTTRGWFEYFKHGNRTTLRSLDGWIRMRLRSILRKRHGGRGRGRGCDHRRWPNAYFAAYGLFTMQEAHIDACRSR
jgi:RNA-directed DNA polymerase